MTKDNIDITQTSIYTVPTHSFKLMPSYITLKANSDLLKVILFQSN